MQVEGSRPSDDIDPQAQPQREADVLSGVRDALDLVPYAVLVIRDPDTIVLANPRSERIFSCPASELVGLTMPMLVPTWATAWPMQARSDRRAGALDRPLGEGRSVSAVRKGGSPFQAELLLAPLNIFTGSYTTVVVKDVALRQELLGGEEHLALSQRVAQMGSWENDLTSGEVRFSRQLYRLLNIEPGSITPRAETVFAQVHPADLPSLLTEVERARECGGGFFVQVRLMPRPWSAGRPIPERFADGALRMVAVQGSIDLDAGGRPVRTVGTVQDVTARITLERALHASDRRFRAAFDQAPIGMALIDARPEQAAAPLMVNAALSQLTGRSVPELLQRSLLDLVHPLDLQRVKDHTSQLSAGDTGSAESVDARLVCAGGQQRWVSLSGTLVRDEDGGPEYVVAHLVDVTDRYRAQAAARQTAARDQRIAAVLQNDLKPWVPHRLGPVRTAYRYCPAGHGETVCGDWVDVFPLPDGRVGVVVGDVAGHGIEAAATMTRLRTMVHLLATSGVSPAGVMRRLNETLHETELGDDIHLATLVHSQLDLATGALLYSSAGHLPMLTLTRRPDSHQTIASPIPAIGGPPIGVIPGWKYTEQVVVLQPGSVLIGYTDGLIERRGHDLDHNVLALLSSLNALPAGITADVEALADAILAMVQPGPTTDDIAVIALAFDPRPDPLHTQQKDRQASGPADALTIRHSRTVDLDDVALPPDRWA